MLQSTIIRLLLILVILLSGCSLQYESYPNDNKAPSTDNVVGERFISKSGKHISCYILIDTKTGNEYLVVPSASVTKLN
jgi:hypothetical protein